MDLNWGIDTDIGMANAVSWTEDFLSRLNEGGTWIVPRSLTSYVFWPSEKKYLRDFGEGDEPIERVLKEMGYTRLEKLPRPEIMR